VDIHLASRPERPELHYCLPSRLAPKGRITKPGVVTPEHWSATIRSGSEESLDQHLAEEDYRIDEG